MYQVFSFSSKFFDCLSKISVSLSKSIELSWVEVVDSSFEGSFSSLDPLLIVIFIVAHKHGSIRKNWYLESSVAEVSVGHF